MTVNPEIDKILSVISHNESVNVVFLISDQGRVESVYPEKNSKQVAQWAIVLTPLFQKLLELSGFRFTKVDYRQGGLWIWASSPTQFLVTITKPGIDTKVFSTQVSPFSQALRDILSNADQEETLLDHELQKLLYDASDQLKKDAESQEGFFGSLRLCAFLYFGVLGEEWVDQSFENLWLTLPIKQKKPMEDLIGEIKKRISHPIKRSAFEHDAKLLVARFTKD